MCFLCSQNAWKASFCSVGNSNMRDHILNRCGVTTIIVFIDFFSKNWIYFREEIFVFFHRNVHISITLISRSYQNRFPIFFERTPFQLKPSIEYSWTHNAENNQRKPMLCFSFIWLQNQSFWCFFSSKHPNSVLLHFSIFRLFVNFVWFSQSELVFLHDFSTLLSDRGSLVYSFLRFNSIFVWIIRTILVARSFDCYFHCINVGLRGFVRLFELLTMRFFGYAAGLAWSLLLAGYYRTLLRESTVNTFHVFHRHSFWTHTNQVTAIYY